MQDRSSLLPQALTYAVLGLAGALAMGLLFHGTELFHPSHPALRFLTLGLAGAVTYSVVVFGRHQWHALLPLVLISAVDASLIGISSISQLGARVLNFLAMGGAAYLYATVYCRHLNQAPLGKTLIMAGLTGVTFLAAAFLSGLLFAVHSFDSVLFWEVSQGFLVGLGLGAGLELAHRVLMHR